ncbi:MAG: hypothetical protein AAFR38_09265 [Planctomycetota bacterium]
MSPITVWTIRSRTLRAFVFTLALVLSAASVRAEPIDRSGIADRLGLDAGGVVTLDIASPTQRLGSIVWLGVQSVLVGEEAARAASDAWRTAASELDGGQGRALDALLGNRLVLRFENTDVEGGPDGWAWSAASWVSRETASRLISGLSAMPRRAVVGSTLYSFERGRYVMTWLSGGAPNGWLLFAPAPDEPGLEALARFVLGRDLQRIDGPRPDLWLRAVDSRGHETLLLRATAAAETNELRLEGHLAGLGADCSIWPDDLETAAIADVRGELWTGRLGGVMAGTSAALPVDLVALAGAAVGPRPGRLVVRADPEGGVIAALRFESDDLAALDATIGAAFGARSGRVGALRGGLSRARRTAAISSVQGEPAGDERLRLWWGEAGPGLLELGLAVACAPPESAAAEAAAPKPDDWSCAGWIRPDELSRLSAGGAADPVLAAVSGLRYQTRRDAAGDRVFEATVRLGPPASIGR